MTENGQRIYVCKHGLWSINAIRNWFNLFHYCIEIIIHTGVDDCMYVQFNLLNLICEIEIKKNNKYQIKSIYFRIKWSLFNSVICR